MIINFLLQVQDKKFSDEGFMAIAGMAANGDEDKMKAAKEISEECKNVTDPDRCEMAIKIGKCMEEGAKKRNLSPDRR